jgi:Zn-dependent protease
MLRWSINLFRVFGIRLAVHFTFLLLLAYVAWEGWTDSGWLGLGFSVVFILLLFTCIVLHELGHSLTARHFGVGVSRILLLPIGGMAEFESIPREPRRELLITLAGPAVNFAFVAILWPFLTVPAGWRGGEIPLTWGGLLFGVWLVNLVMGCFNLIPVFPMDGGRILRSLLAMRWPYLRATRWAATIGKILATAGIVAMAFVMHNFLGCALFAFIFVAGDLEYRAVKRHEAEALQWSQLIRRLYGPENGGEEASAPPVLHGPN